MKAFMAFAVCVFSVFFVGIQALLTGSVWAGVVAAWNTLLALVGLQ